MEHIELAPELPVPADPTFGIRALRDLAAQRRRDEAAAERERARFQVQADSNAANRDQHANKALTYELAIALIERHMGITHDAQS